MTKVAIMAGETANISKYVENVTLTLFFPMFPFDPPENIRKPLVFGCFQGDQKGTLERKGLMSIFPEVNHFSQILCQFQFF